MSLGEGASLRIAKWCWRKRKLAERETKETLSNARRLRTEAKRTRRELLGFLIEYRLAILTTIFTTVQEYIVVSSSRACNILS